MGKNRQTEAAVRDRYERLDGPSPLPAFGKDGKIRIWGVAAHLHDYHRGA
jgi:hypothetical protein